MIGSIAALDITGSKQLYLTVTSVLYLLVSRDCPGQARHIDFGVPKVGS